MIKDEKYEEVLDSGLTLDHYFLLCNIKNGVKPVANKRIQGFLNLLIKKGYIENDELTEKGIDLVQNCEFSEIIQVQTEEAAEVTMDLGSWILKVHAACEEKLFSLTGKKQVRAKIERKHYSFLPNARDLGKNLQKIIAIYKLSDYDKIEKTMLRHIDNCSVANDWFPIMYYYIMKNGASQLVTDMASLDESEQAGEYNTHKLL